AVVEDVLDPAEDFPAGPQFVGKSCAETPCSVEADRDGRYAIRRSSDEGLVIHAAVVERSEVRAPLTLRKARLDVDTPGMWRPADFTRTVRLGSIQIGVRSSERHTRHHAILRRDFNALAMADTRYVND